MIIGIKDSSAAMDEHQILLDAHGELAILVGDERQLARAVRNGAQGSICGVANSRAASAAADGLWGDRRSARQRAGRRLVALPVIAAVKALIAHVHGDPGGRHARAAEALDAADAALGAVRPHRRQDQGGQGGLSRRTKEGG